MDSNKYGSILLVVLYGKEIDESQTIKTLLSKGVVNVKLVLHNNGPKVISIPSSYLDKFSKANIDVELVSTISNKPLSMLYNDFIKANSDYKKYVILDDDSEITDSYVQAIKNSDSDLEVPKIISRHDSVSYYPISQGKVVTIEGAIPTKGTHSIGSGLIIDRRLIELFDKNNLDVFDENYALYGVDISLFRRMWNLTDKGEIFKIKSTSEILHSLSRVEGEENNFRRLERTMDFAISVRRYPTTRSILSFCKKVLINIKRFRFKDLYFMISCYMRGIHPRCRNWHD